ncbi:MAG: Na(+)-translocating NADH-quinone reductase subunit C, partial [Shewanella sp.]
GVQCAMEFWFGVEGFQPFFNQLKASAGQGQSGGAK